jgi:hypothetical protein
MLLKKKENGMKVILNYSFHFLVLITTQRAQLSQFSHPQPALQSEDLFASEKKCTV